MICSLNHLLQREEVFPFYYFQRFAFLGSRIQPIELWGVFCLAIGFFVLLRLFLSNSNIIHLHTSKTLHNPHQKPLFDYSKKINFLQKEKHLSGKFSHKKFREAPIPQTSFFTFKFLQFFASFIPRLIFRQLLHIPVFAFFLLFIAGNLIWFCL